MKIGRPSRPLFNRFWEKVNIVEDPTSCWPWIAGKDKGGYGQIWVSEKIRRARANRVAWFLMARKWPKKCVLHKCDNPACVRPFHLFLGTHKDNADDRARKGRSARNVNPQPGEKNGNAKLNSSQVLEIRSRYAAGEKQVPLAKEFGVSQVLISRIILGEAWKCLINP